MLPECSLRSYWTYELTEIYNGEVTLHSVLVQNEAICAAVEKSRDHILITNKNHIVQVGYTYAILVLEYFIISYLISVFRVQYMNKSCLAILGYTMADVVHKPIKSFDVSSCADQIMRHLDRGFEWEGKVVWKSKNGEHISASCKASPYRPFGK